MEKLKNIRFNLRFFTGSDSFESVHSVDELGEKLRNNQIAFDDLMAYFFSGQLQRWLECHGAKDSVLLEKLRAIDSKATNKERVFSSLQDLPARRFIGLNFILDGIQLCFCGLRILQCRFLQTRGEVV